MFVGMDVHRNRTQVRTMSHHRPEVASDDPRCRWSSHLRVAKVHLRRHRGGGAFRHPSPTWFITVLRVTTPPFWSYGRFVGMF